MLAKIFDSQFTTEWAENESNLLRRLPFTSEILKLIVDFLSTGQTKISEATALDLLAASNYFDIEVFFIFILIYSAYTTSFGSG